MTYALGFLNGLAGGLIIAAFAILVAFRREIRGRR